MNVSTRRGALLAVCAAVALAVAALVRPAPSTLPRTGHRRPGARGARPGGGGAGEPALAVAARHARQHPHGGARRRPDARFEIGSITKGLTGLLFADMVARGEVTPTTTVGALLPVPGRSPRSTLEQLATHRSGLPPVPGGAGAFVRGWWSTLTAGNPYPYSTAEILDAAASGPLDAPPGTYSNLGFAVLGAALAPPPRTGRTRSCVTERVLAPLGMTARPSPPRRDELGPRDLTGRRPAAAAPTRGRGRGSRPRGACGPTSPTRPGSPGPCWSATPRDRRPAPARRLRARPHRLGVAVAARPGHGRTVVWHNGGTGGFTSFLGVDRQAGVAVVCCRRWARPTRRPRRASPCSAAGRYAVIAAGRGAAAVPRRSSPSQVVRG
jgi:CubicO group peptidase (beta-lactamase class C family)